MWRKPADESTNLYPGLVVQDDRVGGSITVRSSRLPIWAFAYCAVTEGWPVVQEGWPSVDAYDYSAEEFGEFLQNLFHIRGESARLLLIFADVNREHAMWWENSEAKERVREQLQRCLDTLDNDLRQ